LLADLLHVNAFDQPNVEEYKRGTRAALGMHL
jgi:glucose-6-phosphate isomerase